jgi:nucleoside-diphosphate-sugar epimerase
MKILVIGGNRFVGLRLTQALAKEGHDLHIVNRTGQAPHAKGATVYKVNRDNWTGSHVDRDWDAVVDFACYSEEQAQGSIQYFKEVQRYIFISTISVYDLKAGLKEEDFNAKTFDLLQAPKPGDYQDGKRRAEATFEQKSHLPTTSVRFPLILGPDDYTRRLEFHVQRIEKNQLIHIPNLETKISMIHAADASRFLQHALTHPLLGPFNVAAPQPIALKDLVHKIETQTGRRALFTNIASDETDSPYGWPGDAYADVSKAKKAGFEARPIQEWIDDLIAQSQSEPTSSKIH